MKTVFASAALAATALAVNPTVKLPYATYKGVKNGNITSWLGMRYAAPPVGALRFAAPQPPPVLAGVQDASQHGAICFGVGQGTRAGEDEDCLFVDLYAPSGATAASKLPVFLWIQGGGFTTDASPNVNGTDFINGSGGNTVTVFLNYRVGPYGFLGGQQFGDGVSGTSLNNGIKDQIQALAWIQKYVAQFGGDPDHVTIGGSSAGGGSVTELLTAYGGTNATYNKLFHAAAAESPFHPTLFTVAGSQFQYDDLVQATGCGKPSDAATIACLRGLSAAALQAQNANYALPGAAGQPLFEYGPTVGGTLWPDYPYTLLQQGRFNKVPTIFGDDANGGSIFVPKGTATQAQADTFLRNNYPALTTDDVTRINQLYAPGNVPAIAPPGDASFGAYYNTIAKAYGDITFACAAQLGSNSFASAGAPTWQYLFNATTAAERAAGVGAAHVTEQSAIFGVDDIGGQEFGQPIDAFVRGYWTSFVRSFDPNAHRAPGSPAWAQWTTSAHGWLEFENGQVGAVNDAPNSLQLERCAFLNSIGARLGQ